MKQVFPRRPVALVCIGALFCMATAPVVAAQTSPPQSLVRLSGYVRHAESREVVRNAILDVDGDLVQSRSNADGVYFLNLTPGRHRLRVRAIGFAPLDTTIVIADQMTTDLLLAPRTFELQRIAVVSTEETPDIDPGSTAMSISRLDLATIRKAPAALGEVDPLRSITLLPGVSRSSDVSTSFSVRGGGSDQNLILLDEATIYNPAHVFGFLSVFNPDAVADVTLYKGAIPPRFGGRLSSVLDAKQREGNASQFGGTASVGLLASRLLLEGPLPKTRGSFLVAARRSYADAFLGFSSDSVIKNARAYFYDLNAKITLPVGAGGSLMASAYVGRDVFRPSFFGADWGNVSGTMRWNQIIASRLFSKVSWTTGRYDDRVRILLLDGVVNWKSHITSQELRVDESWHVAEGQVVEFGAEIAGQGIQPVEWIPDPSSALNSVRVSGRHGRSASVYVGHTVDLGPSVSVQYGARYSTYANRGPSTVFDYVGDKPVTWNAELQRYEAGIVRDSTRHASGTISAASGIEPRVSLRLGLNNTSSVKASYARTRQYLLRASRTNNSTLLDVWEPIGRWIKPQSGDQYALGYQASLGNGSYDLSVETYFKRSYNVLDFVDGIDILLNARIETALLQGVGRARGLEFFLRKQRGDVTGWISYTLSNAEQRFTAPEGAGINGGQWYASPTDKRHDLSVVAVRPVWGRWTLASTFSASSGLPTTYPTSRYVIDGYVVPEFGARNSSRLPVYHRLDLSLTRTTGRSELQFGVFNAYNRFNAQSMIFRQPKAEQLKTEAVQLAVFGIVPSVSYTFKF